MSDKRKGDSESSSSKPSKKKTKKGHEEVIPKTDFFVHVVWFDDGCTFEHPGAIVVAKDRNHAIALLSMNKETTSRSVHDIKIMNLYVPSAVIIGRSDIKAFKEPSMDAMGKPLKLFTSFDHDVLFEGMKAGSLVVAGDDSEAELLLDQKLVLHSLKTRQEVKYSLKSFSITEPCVVSV